MSPEVSERRRILFARALTLLGIADCSLIVGEHFTDRFWVCSVDSPCSRMGIGPLGGGALGLVGLAFYAILFVRLCVFQQGHGHRILVQAFQIACIGSAASVALLGYAVFHLRLWCWPCGLSGLTVATLATVLAAPGEIAPDPVDGFPGGRALAAVVATSGCGLLPLILFGDVKPYNAAQISRVDPRTLLTKDSLSFGSGDHAKARLVAFIDLDCLNCMRELPVLLEVVHQTESSLTIRNMPLPMHQGSVDHAEWFEQANGQGDGWHFLHAVSAFGGVPDWQLVRKRYHIGHPDRQARLRVQRDRFLGARLGIRATPCVIVLDRDARPYPLADLSARALIRTLAGSNHE